MDIWSTLASVFQRSPAIDEFLCNGSSVSFWVEENQLKPAPRIFQNDREMQLALQDLAFSEGLRLDPFSPACGGLLERSGICFRWHTLLPPLARDGPLLSLRRHRLEELALEDFADVSMWQALQPILESQRATLIIGPTGAGKTSLLIALLSRLARFERVAILEQVPEIPRLSDRWIRLAARSEDFQGRGSFALEQVFDELLRLRPDAVAVGELRQEETRALRRALLAGVGPIWGTLHADGPHSVCDRLAELSQNSPAFWQELMSRQKAVILWVQRKKPRLREAWQFTSRGLEIISEAKGTVPKESF